MLEISPPNITVIVLDTMRFDEFAKIARNRNRLDMDGFLVIDKCIAPSSWTLPSHASLFTGEYPKDHGAHETRKIKALDIDKVKLKKRTFVSDLSRLGYHTYGISANPYVHPIYGFNEFDVFIEESYYTDIAGHTIEIPKRIKPIVTRYRDRYNGNFIKIGMAMLRDDPGLITEIVGLPEVGLLTLNNILKKIKAKAIDGWPLEKGGANIVKNVKKLCLAEPFFLFINLMEAHDPYISGKGKDMKWYTSFLKNGPEMELIDRWKRLYSKGASKAYNYAIDIVSDLVSRFGRNQTVIITSDHGQEFNEHGFIGHGSFLHDEIIRVPFAVMLPEGYSRTPGNGYVSLTNIKRYVLSVAAGNRSSLRKLFSKAVYAENFGVPSDFRFVNGIDARKLESAEHYTRRVFR